jgi:DNA polymerase-3 subunit epsilon
MQEQALEAERRMSNLRFAAILDLETTGLDPNVDRAIEVAVMLFDVQHAQGVASFASLIRGAPSNEAYAINHIPPAMLPEARDPDEVWQAVRWIIAPAQIIIVHNAAFDRQFTPDLGRPFVCSENDIVYPGRARGGALASLALSFGLGVASAHRAMVDVDTLSRILTRLAEMGHSLESVLLRAMRPKVRCHSLAPFGQKEIVKAAGFRWNLEEKVWWRDMPLEDAEVLPFKVKVVV